MIPSRAPPEVLRVEDVAKLGRENYLHYFNYDRAHTARLTKGRVPADSVFGARKTRTMR
jgi:hypothetical protein